MAGGVASGVFMLVVAWGLALVALPLAVGGYALLATAQPAPRPPVLRRRLGVLLLVVSLAPSVGWLPYAFIEISGWWTGRPGMFALYWAPNAVAALVSVGLLLAAPRLTPVASPD